jgi:hypothetical protein
MAFGDSDLPMLVGGLFSVAVSFGATTTRGIEDFFDEVQYTDDGSSNVVGRVRGVLLQTSLLGSLTDGSSITVNGTARTVRGQPVAQDDGATSLVYLRG